MLDFVLEDTDGRRRRLSEFRGRPVVLVVAGKDSGEAAARFGAALGPRLGQTETELVTVADAGGVPRLMRGLARGAVRAGLEKAQREAAREAPELPALGLHGKTQRFHILVLDRQGRERGRVVQGDAPVEAQIETVARLLSEI
jgi:hypothetical protein